MSRSTRLRADHAPLESRWSSRNGIRNEKRRCHLRRRFRCHAISKLGTRNHSAIWRSGDVTVRWAPFEW